MQKQIVQLIAHSDDLSSELGLFILGMESNERLYATRTSDFLAHDVMDHNPQPQGTVADELQAAGRIMYGRGRYMTINLTNDIEASWDDAEMYEETLSEVPSHPDSEIMEEIQSLVDSCDLMERDPEMKRLTVNHIAKGYADAEAKWPDPLDHYECYAQIAKLLWPELEYEGQLWTLTFDDQSATLEPTMELEE